MDEGTNGETAGLLPDLDIEVKIGRKIPEGLIKCMRDEASSSSLLKTDSKLQAAAAADDETSAECRTGKRSLDEKIRKLKIDMVRSTGSG